MSGLLRNPVVVLLIILRGGKERDRSTRENWNWGEDRISEKQVPCIHILKVCKSQCDLYLSQVCVLTVVSRLTKKLSLENNCYNSNTILIETFFFFLLPKGGKSFPN